MSKINENALKAALRDGKLEKVYLLAGEDGLLKQKYCDKIKSVCVSNDAQTFDLCSLDGKSLDLDTLLDELIRFPVLSQKRCVVVTNFVYSALKENDRKTLIKTIEKMPESNCFVIYQSGLEINEKDDKWKPLINMVDKHGAVVFFNHRTPAELRASLKELCRRRKVNIDISVLNYMMEVCSTDLNTLKNEADKLCRYKGEGGNITKEDIDEVCCRHREANVFEIARLVTAKNAPKALEKLNTLLFNGESPVMICAILTNSFIDIYRAGIIAASGQDLTEAGEKLGYHKKILFRLQNAQRLASRVSKSAQRACLDILCSADIKLKSTGYNQRAVLENTILQLVSIVKGEMY